MSKITDKLLPEDFGKSLDEKVFRAWKKSVNEHEQTGIIWMIFFLVGPIVMIFSFIIGFGLFFISGIIAISITASKQKERNDYQNRLRITNNDIKRAIAVAKLREKGNRQQGENKYGPNPKTSFKTSDDGGKQTSVGSSTGKLPFEKQKISESSFSEGLSLIQKFQKVKVYTSAEDIILMFGQPNFKNSAEAAFSRLGVVPASEKGKEYWLYELPPHGSWQVAVRDNVVVATSGIEIMVEKLKSELPAEEEKSKDEKAKILSESVFFSIETFTPVVTVPGFTKEKAWDILNTYLKTHHPQNMDTDETELLKPFFLNLLMYFRYAAIQYLASGGGFGGMCDYCCSPISKDNFYLSGSSGKCQDCVLQSIVNTLDWNKYLNNVISAIGNVPREIVLQAQEIQDKIIKRREAKNDSF
jgi:hypothetical protein